MAKLKMKKVRIVALREDRKRLLEHLQDSSLIQIKKVYKSEKGFSKVNVTSQMQIFERNVSLCEQALKVLDDYSREKKGMLSSFSGRKEIDPDDIGIMASNSGKVIEICRKINDLNKTITENSAEQIRINTSLSQLEVWQKLDIPINTNDTKSTAVFIGSLPMKYDEKTLSNTIVEENPKLEFEIEIQHSEDTMTCIVLFAPISQKTMAEDVLRNLGFSRPMTGTAHTPKIKAERLMENRRMLLEESEKAKEEIVSLSENREEIRLTQDYFRIRADKYNVINELEHTKHVFVINGYIPEMDLEKLESLCNRVSTCYIETEDAEDDAPVKLKNNWFSAPAQGILTMYAAPSHADVDPTPLLAFFFYFFFGMMFSDAGYGLLMVIAIGIVLKIFKPDDKMRSNLKLFQYCGVSTLIWGLIFGSIFGDAPAVLYNHFTGASISMTDILPWPTLDPQKDALVLMVISIAFGLVHILVGMGCKFYICLKQKDFGGAFFDTGLWMLLLVGFAVLAVGIATTPLLLYIGAGIAIACAVGLVLTQGRHKKGFGKVIGGLASLYDITSYISDLLSYSRLLALGLTTGVMAQVFNMLATMFGTNAFGIVIMVLILIIGHAINIGLNALGSYVHTMRLQYVEMFSKFYEG
ncbi:MAG: V-type ATP synthase subunit I, partial [Ruminococcus sp.]|nr:V-type ATP synthase subunit I [Ruminococcus sp.]